jgi:RHS repeat-associated protein
MPAASVPARNYDALNRGTVLNYSNGDPTITTTYDQSACLGLSACQNIGLRTSVTDAAGSEAWSYQVDATNHRSVHVNQRTTSSITKTSTYYLDMAGNVTQAVYPTGRVVNYTFDAANRPSTAVDGSNGITYATDFQTVPTGCLAGKVCYTPQGSFYALSIGQTASFTGLNLTHSYNNRLQPNEFKASSTGGSAIDITYGFVDPSTSKNAGHVYSITNNLDTTRSQNFTYDQLNRISSALTTSTHATSPTHCWGETYSTDAWANLQSIAVTTNSNYTGCTMESGFAKTADGNNHLSGFTYDSSGNTQNDGVNSYTWDAESQLKSGGGVNYLYDGQGRRVAKVGTKLYWYGSGGDILAETNATGTTTAEYIFFGGERVAMLPASSTAIYYVEDLLGTSRVTTNNTGVVCYDADFYPYGGERTPYTNTCTQNNYKFEGKERDTETGNDDFGARYYSNRFGRWLSADWSAVPVAVPYANLTNPQTLNLYSMVADDPESFADLDGHCEPWCMLTIPPSPSQMLDFAKGAGKQFLADLANTGHDLANRLNLPHFIDPYRALGPVDPNFTNTTQAVGGKIEQAVSVVAAVSGLAEAGGVSGDAAMASRAQELHGLQDPKAQTMRTTAVGTVSNADGTTQTLVSSSRATLTPAQRAALQPGETAVRGAGGVHAEQKILNSAAANGQTPTAIAPSRPPCPACAQAMQDANVKVIPPEDKPGNP